VDTCVSAPRRMHVRTRQSREQAAPVHPLGVRALSEFLEVVRGIGVD